MCEKCLSLHLPMLPIFNILRLLSVRSPWVLAAVWLASHSLAQAQSVSSCSTARTVAGQFGTWTIYPAPAFGLGPQRIDSHAVDTRNPANWYVSNGQVVLRSGDGGCTFAESFRASAAAPTGLPGASEESNRWQITAVATEGTGAIFLTQVLSPRGSTGQNQLLTELYRSTDNGSSWQFLARLGGQESSAAGSSTRREIYRISQPIPAPSDATRYYVLAGNVLWRQSAARATQMELCAVPGSPQGGNTPDTQTSASVDVAVVDPLDADTLWIRAGTRLYTSSDGCRSLTPRLPPTFQGSFSVTGPDLQHLPNRMPNLLLAEPDNALAGPPARYHVSPDGLNFTQRTAREYTGAAEIGSDAASFAHSQLPDDRIMTTFTPEGARTRPSVYRYNPVARQFVDINHADIAPLFQAQADRRAETQFYFRGNGLLARFSGPPLVDPVVPTPDSPPLDFEDLSPCPEPPLPEPPAAAASLSLASDTLTLGLGESMRSDALLELDARATPVDLFFLMDSSGSMTSSIQSLALSIGATSRSLLSQGFDVQAGLAEFNDLSEVPYRRLAPIGPVDCKISRALNRINPGGSREAHLLALQNAVSSTSIPGVPVGKPANFRDNVLKLVLHATDEFFDVTLTQLPSRDAVAQLYNERRIKHVGINVQQTNTLLSGVCTAGQTNTSRCDLEDISRRTDTLAPTTGIDCNGDGLVDVNRGDPVVCNFDANTAGLGVNSFGSVVAQVVADLSLNTPVGLKVSAPAFINVDAGATVDLNLRQDNEQNYPVTLSCTPEGAGQSGPLRYSVEIGGAEVASAQQTVTCSGEVVPEPPPTPPPPPPPPPPPSPPPAAAPAAAAAGAAGGGGFFAVAVVAPPPPPPAPIEAPPAPSVNLPSVVTPLVIAPTPTPPVPVTISSPAAATSPATAVSSAPAAQTATMAVAAPEKQTAAQTQLATATVMEFSSANSRDTAPSPLPPLLAALGFGVVALRRESLSSRRRPPANPSRVP